MASAEKRGKGKRPWRARYKKPDGTWGSEPGFSTKAAALKWAGDQESDIRAGRWRDPRGGQITLDAWFAKWLPVQTYSPESRTTVEGTYRCHLQPWRGGTPIAEIGPLDVKALKIDKVAQFSESKVGQVMGLLRMLMDDAVQDQRLQASPMPVERRRRGKGPKGAQGKPKRPGVALDHGTVMALLLRLPTAGVLGPMMAVVAVVAAFTGMRWGELFAMQRKFLMLIPAEDGRPASGWYVIDDDVGAVHTPAKGKPYLGPPKGYVGRTVELPPFLVEILLVYMASLVPERELLFTDTEGRIVYRDGSHYNAWRRACDGWEASARAARALPALRVSAPALHRGLHLHDLRHTHKTWLVEDVVPAVARDERLGHQGQGDLIRGERGGQDAVYVHATPVMRARLLAGLQRRWGSDPRSAAFVELISQFFPSRSPEATPAAPAERSAPGERR